MLVLKWLGRKEYFGFIGTLEEAMTESTPATET
jgi:hypothetical protein